MLSNKAHTHPQSNGGDRPQDSMNILKTLNWKIFSVLFIGGLLGVLAMLPLSLQIKRIIALNLDLPVLEAPQIPAVVLLGLIQNAIFLAIAIIVGLILGKRLNLTTPILDRYFGNVKINRKPIKPQNILFPALLTGLGLGVLITTVDRLLFSYYFPEATYTVFSSIPLWKRLLAGFLYGGITAEIIFRLCIFAVLVWILGRKWKTASGKPSKTAYWGGNIIAALISASLHLPTMAILAPLTLTVVLKTLLLKSITGIVCGYLYWKQGLESAMTTHASSHIILQIFV